LVADFCFGCWEFLFPSFFFSLSSGITEELTMTNKTYSGASVADANVVLDETSRVGVSWNAVFAGAVTATAITFILLIVGSAIGFVAVSPWPGMGADAKSITVMTLIWLIITQWISAGLGGYLAGRLRYKWIGVHNHEVFFRDTVHGFLSWALGTLLMAFLLAALAAHAVHGMRGMGPASGPGREGHEARESIANPFAYYADTLFRTEHPDANSSDPNARAEAERILLAGFKNGEGKNGGLMDNDKTYLAQLVAAHTGLNTAEADQRVAQVLTQEENDQNRLRERADAARKAAASFGLWIFLSMLMGAFIASTAAALAGKHQDEDFRMV
jgi:hypothetical protein